MDGLFSVYLMMAMVVILPFVIKSFESRNAIKVKYTVPKMMVLEYLGEVIKVDAKYKQEITLLHKYLLEDLVNCIGFHDRYYYMSKFTDRAYVVFVGKGVGNMTIGNKDISNRNLVEKEDFKVIIMVPEKELTQMLELSVVRNGAGWNMKEYFFIKLPYLTLEESRYYILKDEKSDLSISVKEGLPVDTVNFNNTKWSYMMYNTEDKYMRVNGSLPWTNQLDLPVLQFYLHLYTQDISLRTRTMLFEKIEVYKTQKNKTIVYNNVENEDKCERVYFETCPLFEVDVSYTYESNKCEYYLNITRNTTELYPCQLKMWIEREIMSVDSPIPFDYTTAYYRYVITYGLQDNLTSDFWVLISSLLLAYIIELLINYS